MLSSPLQLPVNDLTGSGGKLPNSTATGESFCLGHTLSNCTALFCSRTGQLRKRIQNLIGIFLMLLSSQFCKQVRDCGMQKPSTEVLLIYSKMLGIKGEVQTSQKFTLILCWLFLFFVYDFELCDSLGWQPYQSILHLWPVQGTRWHLTVWKTLDEANSFIRAN